MMTSSGSKRRKASGSSKTESPRAADNDSQNQDSNNDNNNNNFSLQQPPVTNSLVPPTFKCWEKNYPWLELNKNYCGICNVCTEAYERQLIADFDSHTLKSKQAWVDDGFSNWKHGSERMKNHSLSVLHFNCTEALANQGKVNVVQTLSSAHSKQMMKNRTALLKIFSTLKALAKQGLPLRGDNNDENSNLIAFLKAPSEDVPELKSWLPRDGYRWLHHESQNEILDLMVEVIHTSDGGNEIDPEKLWLSVQRVVKEAIKDAGVTASDVTCLGMSTQRSSFVTWDRVTGAPFHNFITWKDVRAERHVQRWNNSFTMRAIRVVSGLLHMVTRSKRFLAGSVLNMTSSHVTPRLAWAIETNSKLSSAVEAMRTSKENAALFGTVDTWLLHKMTKGRLHATDPSCASATGFYDPFVMEWSAWALHLFKFPIEMLPEVVETTGEVFGSSHPSIWGSPIPITCSVADQAASLYGSCCFAEGDLKVTMGTGAFLDMNTGPSPHASAAGLYPQVAWKLGQKITYMAEGSCNDCGGLVEWARGMGLISRIEESAAIAQQVEHSDGAIFVPAFAGLQAPFNDHKAAAGFIGLRASTCRQHLVRCILEGIAFRVVQLYQVLLEEVNLEFTSIRVDGGVSRNDFICQVIADMTGLRVERSDTTEASVMGAAHLAGLTAGIWSPEEVKGQRKIERVFEPNPSTREALTKTMDEWLKAVDRFRGWYS